MSAPSDRIREGASVAHAIMSVACSKRPSPARARLPPLHWVAHPRHPSALYTNLRTLLESACSLSNMPRHSYIAGHGMVDDVLSPHRWVLGGMPVWRPVSAGFVLGPHASDVVSRRLTVCLAFHAPLRRRVLATYIAWV